MKTINLQDRLKGAIWGQFVGDAAALGAHWFYNVSDLEKQFPGKQKLFATPKEGHYHLGKHSGDHTHYGDAALILLESVELIGHFDQKHFGQMLLNTMSSPSYKGYIDRATRETIKKYHEFRQKDPKHSFDFQQGGDDDEGSTATRIAPVIVMHYDKPDFEEKIIAATKVTQNNARAIAYMLCHGRIMKDLFSGISLTTAFETQAKNFSSGSPYDHEIKEGLVKALESKTMDVIPTTKEFGSSCPLQGSFGAAAHAAIRFQKNFENAILETIAAGGDNAQRCALVGSWLGAFLGNQAIPDEFKRKLTYYNKIQHAVDHLCKEVAHK